MNVTSHILMIRPVHFAFNSQTAVNNTFQSPDAGGNAHQKALQEFDDLVSLLRNRGIDVTTVQDSLFPNTPDSIFPNNWFSSHSDGSVCIFPMYALNRRAEKKPTVIEAISKKFNVRRIIDFSHFEKDSLFLEGTGSMVLDRKNKIAYASLSARTNRAVLNAFCNQMGYTPITFTSANEQGTPIYHTNVMMSVADQYAVVCLDSIADKIERHIVVESISDSDKIIVEITIDQMNHFAGNMLQVENEEGKKMLIMSTNAYRCLTTVQRRALEQYNKILHSNLDTIEQNGGGSARCMIAEIFLDELSLETSS